MLKTYSGQPIEGIELPTVQSIFPTYERTYASTLEQILDEGAEKSDRTGTGTISLHGLEVNYGSSAGYKFVPSPDKDFLCFPLFGLTKKKMHFKSIIHELIWFLNGDTNIKYLKENGVSIWDEWADENGDLGPVYGEQWRARKSFVPNSVGANGTTYSVTYIDQILNMVERMQQVPFCRRNIVDAWNPAENPIMKLPPCHRSFQVLSKPSDDGKIITDLIVDQRSADFFLGVPFNIASYQILHTLLCVHAGHLVGDLIFHYGDAHIYKNHIDQVEEYLNAQEHSAPWIGLRLNDINEDSLHMNKQEDKFKIFAPSRYKPTQKGLTKYTEGNYLNYKADDFFVYNYKSSPTIKAPVAV